MSRPRVYPRVCGGTGRRHTEPAPAAGLSPRVRGNPYPALRVWRQRGSIPACAGEPRTDIATHGNTWVYPRVCGGTPRRHSPPGCRSGLSPRVRGNPSGAIGETDIAGSIPACAGEPYTAAMAIAGDSVYPRVCGGTHTGRPAAPALLGLSPRVRGNPWHGCPTAPLARSIPACAGEPDMAQDLYRPPEVYPRVCGGTGCDLDGRGRKRGLSPRVRGNQGGP